jgi:hypothetical protein
MVLADKTHVLLAWGVTLIRRKSVLSPGLDEKIYPEDSNFIKSFSV